MAVTSGSFSVMRAQVRWKDFQERTVRKIAVSLHRQVVIRTYPTLVRTELGAEVSV